MAFKNHLKVIIALIFTSTPLFTKTYSKKIGQYIKVVKIRYIITLITTMTKKFVNIC